MSTHLNVARYFSVSQIILWVSDIFKKMAADWVESVSNCCKKLCSCPLPKVDKDVAFQKFFQFFLIKHWTSITVYIIMCSSDAHMDVLGSPRGSRV